MILCLGTTPAVQRTMIFKALSLGTVNRAAQVIESPAGKSVNVAKILHTLGQATIATGFLGGDRGQQMRRWLDEAGVPHDFVPVRANTRMCVTLIDQSGNEHTELVEESPQVEDGAWETLLAKLERLLEGARMLVLSGTLVPGGPHDFYARCARSARQRSVPVIADAAGHALLATLPERPLVVKPNRAELAATFGKPLDTDDALRAAMLSLIERGANSVVITLGAQGAAVTDGKRFWRVHSPKVTAVNSIGSGDSFTAGLAARLAHGESLAEACRYGAACGAANALTLVSGKVHLDDVRLLHQQARVEPM